MELARKSGRPLECRNIFGETFQNLRELNAGPYETPLWIEHWKNLQHFACEREAAAAEEKISFLVSNYPFFQSQWEVAQHKLTEEELRKQAAAEDLAYYYRQLAIKAFRLGEASRGVFFLDEAQHFARRARTYPLDNLNACRLSIVKANMPDSRAKPENMIQKTWQGLIRSGIFEGRIEALVLWAWERERQGDSRASELLWKSAERLFERWRSTIPWPVNESLLRERCGLERESWVLAPIQNLQR